jgi:hypothetical protein
MREGGGTRPRRMVEAGDAVERFERTRGIALLWFGLLGPALAWFFHLALSYILVGYACDSGLVVLLHGASLLMIGVTLAAGWVSWKNWNRLGRPTDEEIEPPEGRSRFMAMSGLVMSGFFLLVILAQWIPTFIMPACY